jgi:hypothetical protein
VRLLAPNPLHQVLAALPEELPEESSEAVLNNSGELGGAEVDGGGNGRGLGTEESG